jgi:flagellar biosynthesis/type III secretory pathway M-ring protein FliF/YscJ
LAASRRGVARPIDPVTIVVAILTLALLAAVIVVVSGPLRRSRAPSAPAAQQRAALEAAREAKYREIKDAELDFETGKLSREDYEQLRASLRAEAVEILDRLAALEEGRE